LPGEKDRKQGGVHTGGRRHQALHLGHSYSSTTMRPRMKLCPAPHIFEHSKV
jgi:hypothetical protein